MHYVISIYISLISYIRYFIHIMDWSEIRRHEQLSIDILCFRFYFFLLRVDIAENMYSENEK